MREDSGDGGATLALDVHEEAVWRLDQAFQFVLLLLRGQGGVQEISLDDGLRGQRINSAWKQLQFQIKITQDNTQIIEG